MKIFEVTKRRGLPGAFMALVCATTLPITSLQADPRAGAYEMLVHTETMQGRRLARGDWEAALAMNEDIRLESFDALNNRCVSLTLAKDFDEAITACDLAVASVEVAAPPAGDLYRPRASARVGKAIALTNRGVLHALIGDHESAEADFVAAAGMTKRLTAAEENLEKLRLKDAMARVD